MCFSKLAGHATRLAAGGLLAAVLVAMMPAPASEQYCGRNKVKFDEFEFKIIKTEHWDVNF